MRVCAALLIAVLTAAAVPAGAAGESPRSEVLYELAIPAGPLVSAIDRLRAQSGISILYKTSMADGVTVPALNGRYSVRAALAQLLENTGIRVESANAKTIVLKREAATDGAGLSNQMRVAMDSGDKDPAREAEGENAGRLEGIPEIMVTGERGKRWSLNTDIQRTEDDIQPYVVFDHEDIVNSQATNLEQFFRTRLPMATGMPLNSAVSGRGSTTWSLTPNLRGLGINQTLLLVDGRRLPNVTLGGTSIASPDINGIPLSTVERIEVLPSTASGIYGGSATGGVINIITRKDFAGAILTLNYANSFDSDSARRKAEFMGTSSLRGGATLLTLTASYEVANDMLTENRDFAQRARQLAFTNNPTLFTSASTPPRGYTTNIRNQNGANLVLKPQYGGTVLNSPITFVPVGYAGIAADNAAALAANAGRYNLDLPDDSAGRRSVLVTNASPVNSFGLGVRQKLASWLDGYLDYLKTSNRGQENSYYPSSTHFTTTLAATAPNNPFTTAIRVAFPYTGLSTRGYSESSMTRITGGLVARLPGGWQAGVDAMRGRSDRTVHSDSPILGDADGAGPGVSYTTALSTGSLDVIRDLNVRPLDYTPYLFSNNVTDSSYPATSRSATVRASGPVYRLSAGEVLVSTSVEWQKYVSEDSVIPQDPLTPTSRSYLWQPGTSMVNRSAYLETRVPLLGPSAGGSRQPRFEVQLAGRYDFTRNNTYGIVSLPTINGPDGPFPDFPRLSREYRESTWTAGFRYSPVADLTVRASMGTGFLAPNVGQIVPGSKFTNTTLTIVDPKRGGVPVTYTGVDVYYGGSPDLRPEYSESVSVGLILTPRFWPGVRLSIDYTKIHKTDEITGIPTTQLNFDLEDQLPGRILRAQLTPADQALGYTGGVVTGYSISAVNFALHDVEAVDIQADYTRETSAGDFHFHAMATLNRRNSLQAVPAAPVTESVGFYGTQAPFEWRGNAGVDWRRGSWTAGWSMQSYSSLLVYGPSDTAATIAATVRVQGDDRYPMQFYHDAVVSYRFGGAANGWRGIFNDMKISAGIQNVFDREPPLRAGDVTMSGIQPIEDPRLRRYSINLQKDF